MKNYLFIKKIFSKKILLILILTSFRFQSFGLDLYGDQTVRIGKDLVITSSSPMFGRFYNWITNSKGQANKIDISGNGQNFTGTLASINQYTGAITIKNPGPVGVYQVHFLVWFEMYKDDPNPPYFEQSFTLTVNDYCTIETHSKNSFLETSEINVGPAPRSMVTADFNKDGKLDFAVANSGDSTISIRLGNGAGNFSNANDVSVYSSPYSIVTCDFNKDGNLDLATGNRFQGKISVRFGNGSGGFSGDTELNTWGELGCGDINGDNKPDIVVAGGNHLTSILGDGAGGFQLYSTIEIDTLTYPEPDFPTEFNVRCIQLGDFNKDGREDVVLTREARYYESGPNTTVLQNDGDGHFFKIYQQIYYGHFTSYLTVIDANKDGNLDIIYSLNDFYDLWALLGDGNGYFTERNYGGWSETYALADFDSEGFFDLLSFHSDNNQIFFNRNDNYDYGPEYINIGSNPLQIVPADFNGDGKLDFATVNNGSNDVSIRLQPISAFKVLLCVPNQTKTIQSPQSSFTVSDKSFDPLSYSGNCADAKLYNDYNHSPSLKGASFPIGTTIVKWIITDSLNVKDSCSFAVMVKQNCGAGVPTGSNVFSGNKTISTQTQLNAFFNGASGANNGNKYTKITGSLYLDGGNSSDPITNFCNLSALTEITGTLEIKNFNKTGNPDNLVLLENLSKVGCWVNIVSNPKLNQISLPNLTTVGCSFKLDDNANATSIQFPRLQSIQGDKLVIKNHPKLETLSISNSASSFNFTGRGSNVEVSDNGNSASGNLTMNLKKIIVIKGALIFTNNDNAGVNNFDNIFTGLTDLSTKWGKLIITNNDYLGTCCIAASVNVGGSGNRHIISGNTGNCIDSATVLANCGVFHKKSMSPSSSIQGSVKFNVYPSPNSGLFNLDVMSNQSGNLNLIITDLMGRQIFSETYLINQFTSLPISLTSAATGIYFLKADLNGEVFVKRISIVK